MKAYEVVRQLKKHSLNLACAESLTGGLVCSTIVDVPGASLVFRGGAVTYATDSKAGVLGVSSERLAATGPVDSEVALEMARGARKLFSSDIAVATTGVAGPGASDGHEAGTVWIALAGIKGEKTRLLQLSGGRSDVREGAVQAVFDLLLEALV